MIPSPTKLIEPLLSAQFWRSQRAAFLGRRFDRRYGTDTLAQMPVAAMRGIEPALARHAVHYEASAIPKVRRALTILRRELGRDLSKFSFVDFGSGKGLVVMMASLFEFRQVQGVEMAPDLHAIAVRNLDLFGGAHPRRAPSSLRCEDALRFDPPEGDLVAYLYNPFDATLLEQFVARLVDGVAHGSELIVVYVNPLHRHVFERTSRFRPLFDDDRVSVLRRERPVKSAVDA